MSQKEQLKKSCLTVQKLLKDSHVTEQIQQKEQLTQQITKNVNEELEFRHTKPVLVGQSKAITFIT